MVMSFLKNLRYCTLLSERWKVEKWSINGWIFVNLKHKIKFLLISERTKNKVERGQIQEEMLIFW